MGMSIFSFSEELLNKGKVVVLPHPQYSPALAPCDFFLLPKPPPTPKKKSTESTGVGICQRNQCKELII